MTSDSNTQAGRLSIGTCVFDPATGSLYDATGQSVALRGQSLRVLDLLARHPSQVVTKATILENIWPNTAVTDDSLIQCVKDIRAAISDTRHEVIQTVVGRGYCLHCAPEHRGSLGTRPQLLISHLTYTDASPNAAELAAEVAEQLVIDLSRRSGVMVTTDTTRRDKAQYVIGGRVNEHCGKLRVYLEVQNAATGQSLFAEAWTVLAQAMEELPEKISEKVTNALRIHMMVLGGEELADREDSELSVQELLTKAAYHMNRLSKDHSMTARASLELAVERAPENPVALAMLASMATQMIPQVPFASIPDQTEHVMAMADRAVTLGPRIDIVLRTRANLRLWLVKDHEGARLDCRRALDINPSFHLTHQTLATSEILGGNAEEGLRRMHRILSLAAAEPQYPLFMSLIAIAHLLLGNSAEAFEAARESHELLPNDSWSALVYAACAAGRIDVTGSREFRAMLERIELPFGHFRDMPFTIPAEVEMMERRLREAGFAPA